MADLPPRSGSNEDTGDDTFAAPDRESRARPRWVYVLGILTVALVLLFVILHVIGGGGLGRHTPP